MEYEFHPLADLFPMMSDEEIDALGEDMLANGQRESIALFEGKILDGRNRYLACMRKGIEPRFIYQRPADPVAFVASANLHRRHLDQSQRAMIAAKLADMKRGDNQHASRGETSQAEAARLLEVGKRSVERAREVIDHGTDKIVAAVEVGEVPLKAAAAFVHDHPPSEQDRLIAKAGSPADAVKIHKGKANAAADRAEPEAPRRSRSAPKPQPPKSQAQIELVEFKYVVDHRFPKMDDEAKGEAVEYVIRKRGAVTSAALAADIADEAATPG